MITDHKDSNGSGRIVILEPRVGSSIDDNKEKARQLKKLLQEFHCDCVLVLLHNGDAVEF